MKKPLTRKQFLDEMVEFYSADPNGRRAVSENFRCKYLLIDECGKQRRCSIGRWLLRYECWMDEDGRIPLDALPHQVCDLGERFLSDIQHLHDTGKFWDKENNCLSDIGKAFISELRKAYDA